MIFFLAFIQLSLIAVAQRNASQCRYGANFLTSIAIAGMYLINMKLIVKGDFDLITCALYLLGSACGTIAGMFLHKKFARRKDVADW